MKSLRLYIIVTASLLVIYLIAQFNRPKEINWTETYSISDKTPFGTFIIYQRLNDIFPASRIQTYREPVYNVTSGNNFHNAVYIIVCNDLDINEYDFLKLKKFIRDGNDVFIASNYFGRLLQKELGIQTAEEVTNIKSSGYVRFNNKSLDTNRVYSAGKGIGGQYFTSFDTVKARVLGTNNNRSVNFLKYSIGKGRLFLNANPLLFTNYSLLGYKSSGYASTSLSFTGNGLNILWDQFYSLGREDDGSSMRVFLRNPLLRWAFYISFFTLVLFVLYDMKRRQRIIPVIEPVANETLGFVNVIGQLYYEKRDNADIAHKKILYVLTWLRDKYQIKTGELDNEFVNALNQKFNLPPDFVLHFTGYLNYINSNKMVTDKELIELNHLTDQFYNYVQ